jgi:hypothetical protein
LGLQLQVDSSNGQSFSSVGQLSVRMIGSGSGCSAQVASPLQGEGEGEGLPTRQLNENGCARKPQLSPLRLPKGERRERLTWRLDFLKLTIDGFSTLAKHASAYRLAGSSLRLAWISPLRKMATLRSSVRYSLNPYSFNCDRNGS